VSVKGTDIDGVHGETVLDASQWLELKARKDVQSAGAEFDAAVEAFYAPLIAAAEKVGKSLDKPTDSLAHVVLDEGAEATPGRAPIVVNLSKDSMVLRLLEDGNTDRLIWVDGELEILEVLPGTSVAAPWVDDEPVAVVPTEGTDTEGQPYGESADRSEDPFA
jgi:hypothetical protein